MRNESRIQEVLYGQALLAAKAYNGIMADIEPARDVVEPTNELEGLL